MSFLYKKVFTTLFVRQKKTDLLKNQGMYDHVRKMKLFSKHSVIFKNKILIVPLLPTKATYKH